MSLFEQLQDTIAQTFQIPVANVMATSRAGDIAAWDSLGHVTLMMSLEQTFDIQLDVEDFPTLNSVPAILAFLKTRGIE
jgi:acyl carrier protein